MKCKIIILSGILALILISGCIGGNGLEWCQEQDPKWNSFGKTALTHDFNDVYACKEYSNGKIKDMQYVRSCGNRYKLCNDIVDCMSC